MKKKKETELGFFGFCLLICTLVGMTWLAYHLVFTVIPGAYYYAVVMPETVEDLKYREMMDHRDWPGMIILDHN